MLLELRIDWQRNLIKKVAAVCLCLMCLVVGNDVMWCIGGSSRFDGINQF